MSAPSARISPPVGTRLDRVPTPRPPAAPAGPGGLAGGHLSQIVVSGVVALALAGTGILVADRASAVSAQRAASERVAQASAAERTDDVIVSARTSSVAVGAAGVEQAALAAGASRALADATAVGAASPHAGDALAALSAAATAVQRVQTSLTASPMALRTALAALASARAQVVANEAAWQAAEQARVAAEAAAAAAAAAPAAPARSARTTTRTTTTHAAAPAAPVSGSGTVHAVTLSCISPPGSGTPASASAVGAAINAYRVSNGLPALSVSTSAFLSNHALDMAASGGIWHSGQDNIVGCAPGVSSLVGAWSRSPSHNAQMLRTDVHSMSVGAATAAGYLFAAVKFN